MRSAPADSMPPVFPVDVLGVGAVCPRDAQANVEAADGGVDVEIAATDGRAPEVESP